MCTFSGHAVIVLLKEKYLAQTCSVLVHTALSCLCSLYWFVALLLWLSPSLFTLSLFLPPLTLCSLFVRTVMLCLLWFTTEAWSQTMALLSRPLWPTECATVGLSGGSSEYPWLNALTAGQAGHAKWIKSSKCPICWTLADTSVGLMNGWKHWLSKWNLMWFMALLRPPSPSCLCLLAIWMSVMLSYLQYSMKNEVLDRCLQLFLSLCLSLSLFLPGYLWQDAGRDGPYMSWNNQLGHSTHWHRGRLQHRPQQRRPHLPPEGKHRSGATEMGHSTGAGQS